jgi:hypothetical protein
MYGRGQFEVYLKISLAFRQGATLKEDERGEKGDLIEVVTGTHPMLSYYDISGASVIDGYTMYMGSRLGTLPNFIINLVTGEQKELTTKSEKPVSFGEEYMILDGGGNNTKIYDLIRNKEIVIQGDFLTFLRSGRAVERRNKIRCILSSSIPIDIPLPLSKEIIEYLSG